MSRIRITWWILVSLSLFHPPVHAFEVGTAQVEVEPYVKGGTIAWDELRGIGGHKSLLGAGLNTVATFDRIGTGFNFEKWWAGGTFG